MSLHRHVPLLVATSSLLVGCGRSLLGDTDTDASSDTDSTSDPSDPSGPSDPSTPSGPSDPSVATLDSTVTDPTDPTGPQPMPGPPQLVDATVTGPSTVELFFSEPVSAAAVDPSKFRLSASFANSSYSSYSYGTSYADLGRWNGVEECHEYCYGSEAGEYCNEWCYTPPGPSVHVVAATQGGYTERVTLTLDVPIGASVCKQLRQRLEQGADTAAIFLHYSNNGQGVIDEDGEQLEAIAEHWVLLGTQYYSYQPDFFPAMDPFIPIDCPFV
ncbi:MAG: hypothetical protein IAG13_10780 [Deltaproteobacteria bacterium]|nr:hypothetical protein [Nannocystaceae bacterium]